MSDDLRTELREQAEAQFKALNEAAAALEVPLIRKEMGSYQMALAAGFIALVAARTAARQPGRFKLSAVSGSKTSEDAQKP